MTTATERPQPPSGRPVVPAPRGAPGTPYRVALVCLGNICRSPMAETVLRARLEAAGLADRVALSSAGTGGWHVGDPMDSRAAATLSGRGYDPSRHRARRFDAGWFADADLVLVMDRANRADVLALAAGDEDRDRVRMFRAFDPLGSPEDEVPDPWFGGQVGFDHVLDVLERTSDALVAALAPEAV